MPKTWKRRVAASPIARLAVFPFRVRAVLPYVSRQFSAGARWLFSSREHTNYTFELTDLNWLHLEHFVSAVTGVDHQTAAGYIQEIRTDRELSEHVKKLTAESDYKRLAETDVHFHKRAGWYAICRAIRPEVVVETGTDKGLGSVVLAAAIQRNGCGRVVTIDNNPEAGYLIEGKYADVIDFRLGSSLDVLGGLTEYVDVFIHDSWHAPEFEAAEFDAVASRLREDSVILSDNSHVTDSLPSWAAANQREFLYWQERPLDHWYPGGGIGAAFRRRGNG